MESHSKNEPPERDYGFSHIIAQGLEPLFGFSVARPTRSPEQFKGIKVSAKVDFFTTKQPPERVLRFSHDIAPGQKPLLSFSLICSTKALKHLREFKVKASVKFHMTKQPPKKYLFDSWSFSHLPFKIHRTIWKF